MPPSLADPSLAALLQLASPTLPVGAFSYSQGLERAVHDGIVHDAATTRVWILDLLAGPMTHFEAPVVARLHDAWTHRDHAAIQHWNERYLATRETSELRAETLQMGTSLTRLLVDLNCITLESRELLSTLPRTYPTAFTAAAVAWNLDRAATTTAYLWSWIENQVTAALKSVPLGQVAGQRILFGARSAMEKALTEALDHDDDDLWSSAPGFALACSQHEVQYSRLFRS